MENQIIPLTRATKERTPNKINKKGKTGSSGNN
jgi:hypothetical protein